MVGMPAAESLLHYSITPPLAALFLSSYRSTCTIINIFVGHLRRRANGQSLWFLGRGASMQAKRQ